MAAYRLIYREDGGAEAEDDIEEEAGLVRGRVGVGVGVRVRVRARVRARVRVGVGVGVGARVAGRAALP